jgi:hypothetical protein
MNHWGEPDEVDFPDWMLPDNHSQKMRKVSVKPAKSMNEAIVDIMAKPAIKFTPEDLMKTVLKDNE